MTTQQHITSIDMLTPAETCDQLSVDEPGLLRLVNEGRLAAYNLGGNIRFKVLDVTTASRELIAA